MKKSNDRKKQEQEKPKVRNYNHMKDKSDTTFKKSYMESVTPTS
jgi:hypothetical protein